LRDCVRLAVSDLAAAAAARNITLDTAAIDDVSMRGEADSLRILVQNLLDNAVRHTPEGGRVRVALAAGAQRAGLTIEDSGAGIPPESRERVFDRFYRVPGTSAPGSGLGLAIVKAIADRHGATIAFGTSALGGLRVSVSFPI
jgi:two-component system OmpR family sensor kinase